MGREWISINETSYNDFLVFISKHKEVIVKPVLGSYGIGIKKINIDELPNIEGFYKGLNDCVLEEVIVQDHRISEFNPSSVNTLRINTILGVCLRMGNGNKIADNFHHGGISAVVDEETGIVTSKGMDVAFNEYIFHPSSGKQIVGFEVPNWKEVTEMVSSASRIIPTVRHIGWDIAINKYGEPVIIEGNSKPGFYTLQVPNQIGMWPVYKNVQ